jgi:hypothetical protein
MPTQIQITNLGGASPFDVYTCDTGYTTCVYVSTITSGQVPYTFDLPFIQEGMNPIGLRVIDNGGCVVDKNILI